jgi:uncharacterized membrane protein
MTQAHLGVSKAAPADPKAHGLNLLLRSVSRTTRIELVIICVAAVIPAIIFIASFIAKLRP